MIRQTGRKHNRVPTIHTAYVCPIQGCSEPFFGVIELQKHLRTLYAGGHRASGQIMFDTVTRRIRFGRGDWQPVEVRLLSGAERARVEAGR